MKSIQKIVIEQRGRRAWVAYNTKVPGLTGAGPTAMEALQALAQTNEEALLDQVQGASEIGS